MTAPDLTPFTAAAAEALGVEFPDAARVRTKRELTDRAEAVVAAVYELIAAQVREESQAEIERWVDAHAVLAREVDELRRALSVDDLAAHDEARAEELAPRITAAMLGAYGLGRDDEAAGNPVRTPLDIVENSLPADVPMSSNRGHDLREGIARSTPLTEAGEES